MVGRLTLFSAHHGDIFVCMAACLVCPNILIIPCQTCKTAGGGGGNIVCRVKQVTVAETLHSLLPFHFSTLHTLYCARFARINLANFPTQSLISLPSLTVVTVGDSGLAHAFPLPSPLPSLLPPPPSPAHFPAFSYFLSKISSDGGIGGGGGGGG